ncbi:hypothetical protein ACP4OV_025509 [Aristida adscensionis]
MDPVAANRSPLRPVAAPRRAAPLRPLGDRVAATKLGTASGCCGGGAGGGWRAAI